MGRYSMAMSVIPCLFGLENVSVLSRPWSILPPLSSPAPPAITASEFTGLAKTFISRPHFVLLDEPTSFVDLPHKIRLNRFFKDWANQSNRLVLYSTHDIQFCLNEVDEVLFLFEGHIHQMLPDDFKRSKILKDWIGNFEL